MSRVGQAVAQLKLAGKREHGDGPFHHKRRPGFERREVAALGQADFDGVLAAAVGIVLA